MDIHITEEAVDWFVDELDLESGDVIRFFAKYGGNSSFQSGFTIGMSIGEARKPVVEVEQKGIKFQVDESDLWFFDREDLYIFLKNGEAEYSNQPAN
ncbi:HesB/YadR/YfhF family protein [Bacillaceae bacterium W0354]